MREMAGFLGLICEFFWLSPAQATVRIDINLTTQTMNVESASGSYTWRVSTARSGYVTPRGTFRPYSLQRMHYSRKYHMSPMPYSIFFARGYAIHGTYSVSQLGRPASHGCIRLLPANAATLYHLVQTEGAAISISGSPPQSHIAAAHHKTAAPALSYAPQRQPTPTVDTWQASPLTWWPSAR
ncbi:MAG: L,D-transpeptidase [Beijerinckiaceae bacterium]